jgi:carbamoyl-phosphate synthase small subunit
MDRTTGKVEVTAHNHGFAVDAPLEGSTTTPYGTATVSHVCLNDDVVEGIELRDSTGSTTEVGKLKAFSVQYHPEAAAGPHDAAYLFDRFVDLMKGSARVTPGLTSDASESRKEGVTSGRAGQASEASQEGTA